MPVSMTLMMLPLLVIKIIREREQHYLKEKKIKVGGLETKMSPTCSSMKFTIYFIWIYVRLLVVKGKCRVKLLHSSRLARPTKTE